jgi:hypothetical protein
MWLSPTGEDWMMPIRDLFNSLFRRHPSAPTDSPEREFPQSLPGYPDSIDEPAQICSPKVLLIILDPVMDASSGRKLSSEMGGARPDDLVGRFISEILQVSAGLVRYRIAERAEFNEFPRLADGFVYDAPTYRDVIRGASGAHAPSGFDYMSLLERFAVLRRIERREIDEVWIMGFPHAGLYESVMAGSGAFWCNAPPLTQTAACGRRFVAMGFSYERDLGEMLHSYNHRAEAILAKVFNSLNFLAWSYKRNRDPATIRPDQLLNLFERFILFDQIAPGKAGVGSVHYPPNGIRDYDLGNPRLVASNSYDWLRFPDFQGDVRMISASEWGGGTERAYQRWWMQHLPKTAGRKDGIHNNWWQYVANLDNLPD